MKRFLASVLSVFLLSGIASAGQLETILANSNNLSIGTNPSITTGITDANLATMIGFTATTSAVNYLNLTNAATGGPPILTAKGTDTNIGLTFLTKGTGTYLFGSAAVTNAQLRTLQTAVPTCTTNCGSPGNVVAGTDSAGIATVGTSPSTAFVINFSTTWAAAPACTVTQQTTAANYVTKALTTTTTITVSTAAGPTASDKFSYVCIGTQ
jgi:hypothetical protein